MLLGRLVAKEWNKENKHFCSAWQVLAEAATSAATAAERALSQIAQAGAASSSSSFGDAAQSGLSMASRVLKNPDAFSGEDPYSFPAWKFGLTSWISFGDSQFQKAFDEVEKLKVNEDLKPYSPEGQDLATNSMLC